MSKTDQLRTSAPCATCPHHNTEGLQRLGIDTSDVDYVVALAGNPNTGKSTVFNALTGLRQHTGNWPGKTVTRGEGGFTYNGDRFRLVDLPGTYSLLATSTDEEVARDFILFGRPDVTITVVDATRLERNLNLVLQVLEITDRVVVCLNLMDEAERNGITVDDRELARRLGVPVVPTAARNGKGLDRLIKTIDEMARGAIATDPHRIAFGDTGIRRTIETLSTRVTAVYPDLPNPRWVALRLLEGDEGITQRFRSGRLGVDIASYTAEPTEVG